MLTSPVLSQQTPRFLFRAWSSKSGGNPQLNTPTAITPRAFLNQQGPASIYDIPREKLAKLTVEHLGAWCFDTPFSSWSQSLGFVISEALRRHEDDLEYAHISVIDTKRLPKKNVVLYPPKLEFMSKGMRRYSWCTMEYLAFGTISGDALRAVPLKKFIASGYSLKSPSRSSDSITLQTKVQNARALSALFGKGFELPMMAYLLSFHTEVLYKHWMHCFKPWATKCGEKWTDAEKELVMDELLSFDVPEDWYVDSTILNTQNDFLGGYADAMLAVDLLQRLVLMKQEIRVV
jgi:hypothetical protein